MPCSTERASRQRPTKTYVYKMTVDDGVAPCAPPAEGDLPALLTLAICKPVIGSNAKPGDRIVGITSIAIHKSQKYPLDSVIYLAVVDKVIPSREYFTHAHNDRLDCIHSFDEASGRFARLTTTDIHISQVDQDRDLGQYPSYKNAWVLMCRDFRYFGRDAVRIPDSARWLLETSQSLGQGHRVYAEEDDTEDELEKFINHLWAMKTTLTPNSLADDNPRHVPVRDQSLSAPPPPRHRC